MSVVYHGSGKLFDIAKPSFTRRVKLVSGNMVVNYEGISLHATPYEWIALSYCHSKPTFHLDSKRYNYSAGVPIARKNEDFENKNVYIFGKKSLTHSLKKLYGKGGYLYVFDSDNFHHYKGLGENEVASFDEQVPVKIIHYKDVVGRMKRLGVTFKFVDVTKYSFK